MKWLINDERIDVRTPKFVLVQYVRRTRLFLASPDLAMRQERCLKEKETEQQQSRLDLT